MYVKYILYRCHIRHVAYNVAMYEMLCTSFIIIMSCMSSNLVIQLGHLAIDQKGKLL